MTQKYVELRNLRRDCAISTVILHPIIHRAAILLRNFRFPIISPSYQALDGDERLLDQTGLLRLERAKASMGRTVVIDFWRSALDER